MVLDSSLFCFNLQSARVARVFWDDWGDWGVATLSLQASFNSHFFPNFWTSIILQTLKVNKTVCFDIFLVTNILTSAMENQLGRGRGEWWTGDPKPGCVHSSLGCTLQESIHGLLPWAFHSVICTNELYPKRLDSLLPPSSACTTTRTSMHILHRSVVRRRRTHAHGARSEALRCLLLCKTV